LPALTKKDHFNRNQKNSFRMQQVNDTQLARATAFKALHERPGIFVIPNPWDAGSAKILTQLGFEALATTSAGLAFSLGKPDGEAAVSRDQSLENARAIVSATNLPVAADLENGYGDAPEACAETILQAAATGLVGGSIEDTTGHADDPIHPFDLAVERVKAAVQAVRSLPFPFTLTARAENFLYGRNDLKDTIRRLEAFAEAGADVLFAPGLKTKEEIGTVVRALAPRPINVILGLTAENISVDDLAALGVKRVSLGSTLARAAYSALRSASEEILQKGTVTFAKEAFPYADMNALFRSL
jgi:2-methylisocitrate lyase-like PEP mutase family enzyme